MRRHAKNVHQNATKVTPSTQPSKPTVTPEVGEDETYRVVNPNPKRTLDIGGGEVWVPTGPTVVNKAYPLVAITPMGPPAKAVSARANASTSVSASSSKGASSVASKPKPVIRPASTSASISGWHTPNSASVSSKRKVDEPTPGPSKVRRVDNARSVSASKAVAGSSKTITHIAAPKPLFTSAALKTKASAAISSGSASTSASKKRPADGSIPEPSSSKVQRVSKYWPTIAERKATKAAEPPQPDAVPLKAPVPSTQPMASTNLGKGKGTRPVVNASPVPGMGSAATAPTPAKKGPPKPRPVVKPGTLAQTSTQAKTQTEPVAAAQPSPKSKKHLRPTITAGVAASSASSGYSTSTHGSSSSPRTSATPAPALPAPRGSSMSRKCRDCGGWIDPYGKNGLCTMCYVESLPAAPPPLPPPPAPAHCVICKEEWAGKGSECTVCRLKALSVKNRTANDHPAPAPNPAPKPKAGASASANVVEAKPRKKRVSRQMRQREFERWFAKWTTAHRARRIARPHRRPDAAEEDEEENEDAEGNRDRDKTDWWRVESTRRQGGLSYPTPDAFFAALGDALARHREMVVTDKGKGDFKGKGKSKGKGEGGEEGAGGVLTFFGGYSIVAQPKISAMARLDKLVGRMEEIGFRLDSALQGYVKFQYKSARGLMDEVYKYPCTCGGTPPPVAENEMRHAHRIPDEKYAGEVCGGTIMLMVGEDNALLAYGIQGQRIAVDIVH